MNLDMIRRSALEPIRINPRRTFRNHGGPRHLRIKLGRADAADDSVDVSHLAHPVKAREQQRSSHPLFAIGFGDARRAEESAARTFISAKANDLTLMRRDINRNRFV